MDNDRTTAPLSGKRVLVAGDAERWSAGIVHRLLAAGADVMLVDGAPERLEHVRDGLAPLCDTTRLTLKVAEPHDPDAVASARAAALDLWGELDAVVANLGAYHAPRLVDASSDDFARLGDSLRANLEVARAFIPLLEQRPESAYILINDSAAFNPKPGAGIAATSAAGQLMLARSLSLETGGRPHVHSLVVTTCPTGTPMPEDWLTPDNVGEVVVRLVGDPGPARGDVVLDVGWRDRMASGDGPASYL